ncbi:MAG TPA: diaminopimelate epimerase [Rhodothermales bacterium]|nr:diaminopimelate epimerase [Rhodothermales bacterium]
MQRKLVLEFTKMNGAGNDFVVIDNRFYNFSEAELSDLAHRLCVRRVAVGADGLLAFATPEDPQHHYRMRYYNADGSLGTMCGNGARCLARFARLAGIQDPEMTFESDAGLYRASVPDEADGPVRIYVQPPRHFTPNKQLAGSLASYVGPVHYIWTGTEHVVSFVEDVDATPVDACGRAVRHDEALAPTGANVNFVQVMQNGKSRNPRLRVRTFEKGVEAETLACGTGAMASALVARLMGLVSTDRVDVEMPGGTLSVGFDVDGNGVENLYLEGPAEFVFRGTVEI